MKTNPHDTVDSITLPSGHLVQTGLTKREYFAMSLLNGIIINTGNRDFLAANEAVAITDLLIAALNKSQSEK